MTRPVDLLVLDEPTNRIAPGPAEEPQAALDRYSGAVVVVSHHRRLRRSFTGQRLQPGGHVCERLYASEGARPSRT